MWLSILAFSNLILLVTVVYREAVQFPKGKERRMGVTERTYGGLKLTDIETLADDALGKAALQDCAAHIRELQAELAELKLQHIVTLSQAAELESEKVDLLKQIEFHLNQLSVLSEGNAKLKAERREFVGHVVDLAVDAAICAERGGIAASIEDIIEQELNR